MGSLHKESELLKEKEPEIEIHDINTDSQATPSERETHVMASLDVTDDPGTEHVLTKEDHWKLFEEVKRVADAKAQAEALDKQ